MKYSTAATRILLALVFLGPVVLRLMTITSTPDGYLQYQMTLGQFGLPGIFAPLLILIELVCGLSLFLGFKTRLNAYALAALALFLALVLGRQFPEMLFVYLGVAAGMFLLAQHPQTSCALDNKIGQ